ncbi:putative p-loop containing nucleoside triphosphate hydrolase [Erysiphe neolycopersici]|uniref:Putative p-loop containing nucleoside triphosphate hydrolase n=1 Tax=Erysiphe neolycopersici TaxID=212602 RepID=A0A420HF17_9PEZI|nr:putative p-loop containing nucleoside triphosphate hydrolase [Erysiphe neolycopersici]
MSNRLSVAYNLTGNFSFLLRELQTSLSPRHLRVLYKSSHIIYKRQLLQPRRLRYFSSGISNEPPSRDSPDFEKWALGKLPRHCPGCGAPSQTVDSLSPGYYDLRRHAVLKYLGVAKYEKKNDKHDIIRLALQKSASLNLSPEDFGVPSSPPPKIDKEVVKCFRCRNLLNHRVGIPINHPSIGSIRETIHETPYKYNHVYHIIDAADFPMSVIPDLPDILNTSPLRSRSRRSKSGKFYKDKKIELSFIITRSDLLAPLKEHVDSMMPYLRATLRDALGRSAAGMRLGNVRCVSVKRDWWIKELKEDVWNRGGTGWMVGKVNVGKSQLFGSIFPKGRKEDLADVGSSQSQLRPNSSNSSNNPDDESTDIQIGDKNDIYDVQKITESVESKETYGQQINDENLDTSDAILQDLEAEEIEEELFDTKSLLPPAPPEVNYPTMPIVSDLPGTTASPIRLLFGNGKGELIDLPGLKRGELEQHVLPAYRSQLVMRSRIEPVQEVMKPNQSLLIGGIIRITPTAPDIVILAYAFTPILSHLTNTEKAIGIQKQTSTTSVLNISVPGIGPKISSAGKFLLKWDVTKRRTGPVTAHDAGRVNVDQLPYRVIGTDILIEGCGWVELTAQVSKRRGDSIIKPLGRDSENIEISEQDTENKDTGEIWPGVEIFSPHGKYVAARRPMNAWSFIKNKPSKRRIR